MIKKAVILLLGAIFMLQCGCIGGAVLSPKFGATISYPRIGKKPGQIFPTYGSGEFWSCSGVTTYWGEPDSIEIKNDVKLLTNNEGIVAAGIMPYIGILPIPLLIPVGRASTTLECVDDSMISASKNSTELSDAWCALIIGCHVKE